jgi:hypothetical protein
MNMNNDKNKWESDEEEMDYEEVTQNEVPPPDIDNQFLESIEKVKHSLYDNTVLSPSLGSSDAQSKKVLQEYLNKLNDVYLLSLEAQNNKISDDRLRVFPEKTREAIKQTLEWITDYFSKNRIPDTIPYAAHIQNSFHTYPFIQTSSFPDE